MATSDGESYSAEDRALAAWEQTPHDGSALHHLWPIREDAFREGFRAGQEHAKPQRVPGYSRIDDELSKIRDRLNALESSEAPRALHERIDNLTNGINERLDAIEAKLRLQEPIGLTLPEL